MTMQRLLAAGVGALLVLSFTAVALAKVISGAYAGTTSEKLPVSFAVSKHRIKNFSTTIGYNGKCKGPTGGPPYTVKKASIPIKSGGKFSASVTFKFTANKTAHVKPLAGKVSGKIEDNKASGTVAAKHFKTCNGYSETFTATS